MNVSRNYRKRLPTLKLSDTLALEDTSMSKRGLRQGNENKIGGIFWTYFARSKTTFLKRAKDGREGLLLSEPYEGDMIRSRPNLDILLSLA